MSQICESCGGANPVVMLLTRLDNGETDRACDQDLPIMLTGQLALWLGLDPQALYDAIKRHADKVARDQAKATATATDATIPDGLPAVKPDPDGNAPGATVVAKGSPQDPSTPASTPPE